MLLRPQPSLQPPLPLVGGFSFSKVSAPQGPLPEHQLQLSTGRPWGWWAMCPSRPVPAPSGLPAQSPEPWKAQHGITHHWCLGSRGPRPAQAAAVPAPPSLTDLRFRGIGVRNPAWTPGSQDSSRGSLTRAHHHADPQLSGKLEALSSPRRMVVNTKGYRGLLGVSCWLGLWKAWWEGSSGPSLARVCPLSLVVLHWCQGRS